MSNAIRYGRAAQEPALLTPTPPQREIKPIPTVEPGHLASIPRKKQLLIPTETDVADKVYKIQKPNKRKINHWKAEIKRNNPNFPHKVYDM